jgi:hypothetical protein
MDWTICPRCGGFRFGTAGGCMDCGYNPHVFSHTSTYTPEPPIAKGWQCPLCNRVMAPFMPYCLYCNGHMGSILPYEIQESGNLVVNGGGIVNNNFDPKNVISTHGHSHSNNPINSYTIVPGESTATLHWGTQA